MDPVSDEKEAVNAEAGFLGTGWSFPPRFSAGGADVLMTSAEEDIRASLEILLGTRQGERLLNPRYGLDLHEVLFEPNSTTTLTLLEDRMRLAFLIHEPRITLLSLRIDSPDSNAGALRVSIEYQVRATNSRFNLVYPFYQHDSNEMRALTGARDGSPPRGQP